MSFGGSGKREKGSYGGSEYREWEEMKRKVVRSRQGID